MYSSYVVLLIMVLMRVLLSLLLMAARQAEISCALGLPTGERERERDGLMY